MQNIPIISFSKNKKTGKYKKLILLSAEILKRGGIIVAPTDTIYGLLAKATDKKAIVKIQKIKGRDKNKPMPVLIKDIKQAKKFAYLSSKARVFSEKLWPGPYTFVLKAKYKFPTGVVASDGSVGMRVPDSKWLNDLINKTDAPLVATSANLSSHPGITSMKQAIREFEGNKYYPDMMVNGGKITSKPSVVIDMRFWPPKVLRGNFKVKN